MLPTNENGGSNNARHVANGQIVEVDHIDDTIDSISIEASRTTVAISLDAEQIQFFRKGNTGIKSTRKTWEMICIMDEVSEAKSIYTVQYCSQSALSAPSAPVSSNHALSSIILQGGAIRIRGLPVPAVRLVLYSTRLAQSRWGPKPSPIRSSWMRTADRQLLDPVALNLVADGPAPSDLLRPPVQVVLNQTERSCRGRRAYLSVPGDESNQKTKTLKTRSAEQVAVICYDPISPQLL